MRAALLLVCLVGCTSSPELVQHQQAVDSTYVISWPALAPGACTSSTNGFAALASDRLFCTHEALPAALVTNCRMLADGAVNFELCNRGGESVAGGTRVHRVGTTLLPPPALHAAPHTFTLTNGMELNDTFRIYSAALGAGRSYTAWTTEVPDLQGFRLSDLAGTASSLCRVINADPERTVTCTDLDIGAVHLDPLSVNNGTLYVFTVQNPGHYWSPALPGMHTVTGLARTGNTVTATTYKHHGLSENAAVYLDYGLSPAPEFPIGWKTVLSTTPTSFTYSENGPETALSVSYVAITGSIILGADGERFPASVSIP
jgi:hypothetical protein